MCVCVCVCVCVYITVLPKKMHLGVFFPIKIYVDNSSSVTL